MNLVQLAGRNILVTGASAGIGRETAILLSQLGARIILVGRDSGRLAQTAAQLEGSGHASVSFDLTQLQAIPEWIKSLSGQYGPFGGLVHCAGIHQLAPLCMLEQHHIDDVLRVNLHAALMLAKGICQRGVNQQNASLVFISSVMGLAGQPGSVAYAASKGALIAATRSLALELAPKGHRVNCIAPAFVQTEMFEDLARKVTPGQLEKIKQAHPLGLGRPRDVANAAAFLLAETSRWITGTTLVVDGGYTAL